MSLPESPLDTATAVTNVPTATAVVGRSPTQLAIRRFRKDKLSMLAFVITATYVVLAAVAPILVKIGFLDPYTQHQGSKQLDTALGSIPYGNWGGATWKHPLGIVPQSGTDVMSRLWYGITFSLSIALAASLVAIVLGTVLGIVSGFAGGIVDTLVGRLVDLTLSFPQTLMLLALSSAGVVLAADLLPGDASDPLPNGFYEVLVLGLFGWPPICRLIRGQVLSLREREFVEAARLFGASRTRMYFKEILPNLWAPVLVSFTLTMPAYISAEAALSFLGVGVHPPTPTLGNVLLDSVNFSVSDFTYFFYPALLIAIIVVSFNLFGDGLRDALDPKADR
jgi:peptide/nickel transport system permease protein